MELIKKFKQNKKVWVTADLHLSNTDKKIYRNRGFKTVKQYNNNIIENILLRVNPDDELYILGDIFFGSFGVNAPLLFKIPGNVHVIVGEHDTEKRISFYRSLGWDVQVAARINWGPYKFLLSHYETKIPNINKKLLTSTINLYGHTHQKNSLNENNKFSYNVGLDANDNCPVLLEDIIEQLKAFD